MEFKIIDALWGSTAQWWVWNRPCYLDILANLLNHSLFSLWSGVLFDERACRLISNFDAGCALRRYRAPLFPEVTVEVCSLCCTPMVTFIMLPS